jgi:hypothetical protein
MPNLSTIIFGVAFVAIIFSGYADLILGATWRKFYFTSGVLVFRQQISIEARYSNIPASYLFEKRLSSCWMGSFTFKELGFNQYGFRQKLFSFTWNSVIHGLIVFDTENNLVTVKGYLNWTVISLTAFLLVIYPFLLLINGVALTEFLNLFALCVIWCGLVFGLSYLKDRSLLKIITTTAAELWSRKYVNKQERA